MARKHEINAISNGASVVVHIVAILFSLLCIIPFLLIISVSLTDEVAIMKNGYQLIPESFSLEGYKFIFTYGSTVFTAYMNTILSTVIGTVANVVIIALYAYPLSRPDFPYKRFFSGFILILMLFSGGFVSSYIINVQVLQLKNTWLALVLPSLGAGFYVFVTRTFFQKTIPYEIIESTKIDGCSEGRIFWQIVLPLSLPVLAVNALINIYGFWNNWMNSLYYITDRNLWTLQYVMQKAMLDMQFMRNEAAGGGGYELLTTTLPAESARMAMVIFGIWPIILAYPFLQKYFIKGLTVGSVKG